MVGAGGTRDENRDLPTSAGRGPDPEGAGERPRFVVARNPDPSSKLAYLLKVPLPEGPLVFKAGDVWPRTARVYCHWLEEWPSGAEIVSEVPVRACARRGVAVDLVLDRGRENRSQFVFTTLRSGREAVFWQSARTAARSRPGVRVPTRRGAGRSDLEILVDSRERYPYRFARQKARTRKVPLAVGDYAVALGGIPVAAVERKTLEDLATSLVNGSLAFAMAELASLERAAVVVEDRYAALFRLEHVAPGFVADLVAAVQVRYPGVPVVFCDSRKLAEEWAYRFLAAAISLVAAQGDP